MDHPGFTDVIPIIIGQLTASHGRISLVCKQWQVISQCNVDKQVSEFVSAVEPNCLSTIMKSGETVTFQVGPLLIEIYRDYTFIWIEMKFPSCSVNLTYSIEDSCPQCYTDFQYDDAALNHEFFQRIETWICNIGLGHLLPKGNRVLCACPECNNRHPSSRNLFWGTHCYVTPQIIELTPSYYNNNEFIVMFRLLTDRLFIGNVTYTDGVFSHITDIDCSDIPRYPLNNIEVISGNYQYVLMEFYKQLMNERK